MGAARKRVPEEETSHPAVVAAVSKEPKKMTGGKYKTRKQPPYLAEECAGTSKMGNDGRMYKSERNKKGKYRWLLNASLNKSVRKTSKVETEKVVGTEITGNDDTDISETTDDRLIKDMV